MSERSGGVRVGIDVGRMLANLVLSDLAGGRMATPKVLATGSGPSQGAIGGLRDLLANENRHPWDVDATVHGTTLVVNAITERKGAVTGLRSAGFADILDVRTERRRDAYDLGVDVPAPLVPRRLRRPGPDRAPRGAAAPAPADVS